MKKIFFTIVISFLSIAAIAQSTKSKLYFVTEKDTVFCEKMYYTKNAKGLCTLQYKEINGDSVSIVGRGSRKRVPKVLTFYIDGSVYDRVPFMIHGRKNGFVRYDFREIDGKIIVYLDEGTTVFLTPGTYTPTTKYSGVATSYKTRFYVKWPDGKFYKANSRKNMNKIFKPYLMKCKSFTAQCKGKYKIKIAPFMDMIRLYNSVCE